MVIIIPGSGNGDRSLRTYWLQAEGFARRGVAVFYYDKRSTGTSGGDWEKVGFQELADDATNAIPELLKIKRLKNVKIGFAGYSQGNWINFYALKNYPQASFLISVSGSMQTPAYQGNFVTSNYLRNNGHSDSDISLADSINNLINNVYLSNSGWDEIRNLLKESYALKPWLKNAIGLIPQDSWNWKWYAALPTDYDPKPDVERLKIPLLAIHGGRDPLCNGPENFDYLESLRKNGMDITNYFDPEGSHLVRYKKAYLFFWKKSYWKDEYWKALEDWLIVKELV